MLLNGAPVYTPRYGCGIASPSSKFEPSAPAPVMKRVVRSRKPLIENPRELAGDFACAVTEHSTNQMDWVARNGDESLFQTLQRIVPEIGQPQNGRHRLKGKMTNSEFNKFLQSDRGFMCARTRKQSLARTAGNWLFCNRRWLNPLKRDEREKLEQNYDKLCASFPAFARCSKTMFIQFLMDVTVAWTERIAETPRRSAAAAALSAHAPPRQDPSLSNASTTPYVMSYDQALRGPCPARPAERHQPPCDACRPVSPDPPTSRSGSPGSSPYDSADDGGAATCAGLNAGEAMDLCLFRRWAASGPAWLLKVEAGELERFGRSTSF